MLIAPNGIVTVKTHHLYSKHLQREVIVDCYEPAGISHFNTLSLLLINDGQDLITMHFNQMLESLLHNGEIQPLLCAGIRCSADRKNEYGTANTPDYKGRGAKASLYTSFVIDELLPFLHFTYHIQSFKERSFAGFSLGGLSAMDIVINHPALFTNCGIFSGSFWWRDKDQKAVDFDENIHRIIHRKASEHKYAPWLKFFFEVGTQDETADRNNNGIIDAIDDTLSLIEVLKTKGYSNDALHYLELKDGKHDLATWAKAFPFFLKWAFGQK